MTPTEERIRQKLNELPEPYRSQALSQVDPKWFKNTEHEQVKSRCDAVCSFAHWENTVEGFVYWRQLYDSLPTKDQTPDSIQSEINELQSRIDTLKEQLKNLNNQTAG